MSKKKKKQKKTPDQVASSLAERLDKLVQDNPNGNPFKGMKLTDEERQLLAEAGCV